MGLQDKSGSDAKPPRPRLRLDDVELDLGRYELRRSGKRIRLENKPMELLIFLVQRREQMVSRQDIVTKLWRSDPFIDTERNINNIVRKIRDAIGDDAAKPRYLETVIGKGYRFIGQIRVISPLYSPAGGGDDGAGAAVLTDPVWRADRASLAVLPFRCLDDPADRTGLGLGFADGLVSRLANLQGVDVLPTSAILNVPTTASATEVAPRLGVRFVLHGAIQHSKGTTRLSAELFDSHLQAGCFARKFVVDGNRPFQHLDEIATDTASALKRPLHKESGQSRARHSRDPLAYAEFIQGYQRSSSGDAKLLEEATQHLMNAVARDPAFALAHAILSFVLATRHFEFDPRRNWLERAEFHCQRSLELDSALPEGHVANAFLLWGPSRNFRHIEAIAELKRALALQKNLPHAYSRLGTIFSHIGLLDHARTMFERGAPFNPKKAVSHSICQAFLWGGEYERARDHIEAWRAGNPISKYAMHFALQLAISTCEWNEAHHLLDEAAHFVADDPLIISFQGVVYASLGNSVEAMGCMDRACTNPKSFGHSHHTYYQIACILSLLNRQEVALEWLERSVDTGFACWPFFLKDPSLKNIRGHSQFDLLVSSLQAKYPDELGLLGTA